MLAKLTDGHIYLISFIALLIKRIPKNYTKTASKYYEFTRSPGIIGRVRDAHTFSILTCKAIKEEKWEKDPFNLPMHLMTHVFVVLQATGYLLILGGMGALFALAGLNIVDHTNPVAQALAQIFVVGMMVSLTVSLCFGFPVLRAGEWLQKEEKAKKEEAAVDADNDNDNTFTPPGKFRPRFLSSLAILLAWGALDAWLLWLLESELMLSKVMLWI